MHLVVVNTRSSQPQEGVVTCPAQIGLPPVFAVEDLLTGRALRLAHRLNYVRLDPAGCQTHVFRVVT